MNASRLASIACSRLCHDLLGSVGALSNAIELMATADDAGMRAQCSALAAESTAVASARLQFFRIAFGMTSAHGEMMPVADARDALANYVAGFGRVTLDWTAATDTVPHGVGRLALLLAMTARETMPRGGQLAVALTAEGGIVARATAERRVLDDGVRQAFAGEEVIDAKAKAAPALLAAMLADDVGGTVAVEAGDDGTSFIFRPAAASPGDRPALEVEEPRAA